MRRINIARFLEFEYKDNIIFKLDPRVKLITSILYMVLAIVLNDVSLLAIMLIPLIVITLLARVLVKFAKSMLTLSPFIALILIVNYLTLNSLTGSLIPVLRFILFLAAIDIFFFTTSPDDFGISLEYMRLPLSISLSFMLALRFIPTMATLVNDILDAQLSRGLKIDQGGFMKRIKNIMPVIIPVIILSIKKSIEVAESLEVRGLNPYSKHTPYVELNISKNDILFLTINIIIIVSLVMLSILNIRFFCF